MRQQKASNRQEQSRQTKQRLFDAAYSLLNEKSFEHITVREIVRRADVSIGTFYLYFPSKLDVYYQTYRVADAYFNDVVAPMLTEGSAADRLMLYFDQYAIYNTERTSLKLTKLLYNSDNKYFNRSGESGMLSVLAQVVEYGIARGEFDSAYSVEETVLFLMSAVRGLVYNWCTSDGSYDLRQAMRNYLLRLLRAVRARPRYTASDWTLR